MIDKKIDAPLFNADIIILQGDNLLSINNEINSIISGRESNFSDLNAAHIDGATAGFLEISSQLNMLPLGGDKRVVIIDNAHELVSKKEAQDWLAGILGNFPPTTILVMVLSDEKKYQHGNMVWKGFGQKNWLRKMLGQSAVSVHWGEMQLPSEREMPNWILQEAKNQGGDFHPSAAVVLTSLVGNNLFQARQEIDKAISYVPEGKQVGAEDISLLCAASKEESVFSLVDAIGQRDGRLAFKLLHELSANTPYQSIFSMVVRQIRMLILTKETLAEGGGETEVLSACGIRFPFLAKKLIRQSRQFKPEALKRIFRHLDRMDEDSKIGRISLEASLEGLIAGVCK